MAFTFAHEYAHWVTRSPSETVANRVGCFFNPSYHQCS